MPVQWDADVQLSPGQATALIETRFPDIRGAALVKAGRFALCGCWA